MNLIEQITLIDGTFSEIEAKEILQNVIGAKIQFHSLKNFSMQERFGKNDENSIKRMNRLQQDLELIHSILQHAKKNQQQLNIHSTIQITLQKNYILLT